MIAEHAAIHGLLSALIARKRLDGTECVEIGHLLHERAQASGWEMGDGRIVSLGSYCSVCQKPVLYSEKLPAQVLSSEVLLERAERETLKDLQARLRGSDRRWRRS